ncbi:tRNA-dihydrouridine synthase [Weissella ceti]|uniref:tRNA-dihydrouridine synthase n=1 Tax=Weissella ceti TaxID=759620 RepID=A0ABT3E4Y7_9LACO|nr:tRNA-dihydrouridine synthase [Weissella ceti]MCW0953471.1 tRNA-dihydrouridine synthase [Weissella ceti]MCW0953482.1 tRNA-dihydrouridine synthase [Weissella ceti]QVK12070.1 tRNA-dihydrouridine synthase [Weissella ceti]
MVKAKSAYWQNIVDAAQNHPEVEGIETLPFFTLAPMEAVTDTVFRRVVAKAAAPEAFYTEFTNARSMSHPKAKFTIQGRLQFVPEEHSIPIAQLWGDRPIDFDLGVKDLKERGFEAVDINMGCPDSTVIKNGGGSDLIRNPEKAAELIAAAKLAGLPVSVKTRLGFNKLDTFREWLPFLLKQDVQVLTVHLRTRKEMSKVPAHYEYIDEILAMRDEISPNTLIQINGDIKNRAHGLEIAKEHPGLDGIMIGRGVFEDPYTFEDTPAEHTLEESLDLLRMQLDLHDEFDKEFGPTNFQKLKRFFKIYVRGFSYASDLRVALMDTKTTDDAREILAEFNEQWQARLAAEYAAENEAT